MSLLDRLKSLGNSKQGKDAIDKAKDFAEDPKNRKKVTDAADDVKDAAADVAKKVRK